MTKYALVVLSLAVAACSESSTLTRVAAPTAARTAGAAAEAAIPDEFIVVFRPDVSDVADLAQQLAAAQGASIRFIYQNALKGFAAQMSSAGADALARNPLVSYVEQDQVVNAVTTETLSGGSPWGIDRIDAHTGLDSAYNYSLTGAGVTAYIIDTGILTSHTEFAGRASGGYTAISDGNGTNDCNGHGTHVSGTVGGSTYGVAKSVSLVAVRVLDCSGSGTVSGVIAGIDWVTAHHATPAVANMSLGGGASSSLDDAVRNSITSGVSYAIAAGNGNLAGIAQDACNYSPARVTEAMTIGATDRTDTKASWSNYGSCVDWFAPGVGIKSAWNTSTTATNTISGTSMATPHTTGVAALYLQANPSATPLQVRDALFNAATKGIVINSSTANNHLLYSPPAGFGAAPQNAPPTASFTFACTDLACGFTDHSTDSDGTVNGWSWTFGDGVGSTTQSPSHTYAAAGTYQVSLIVTDNAGAKDTATQQVTVTSPTAPPPASATLTVTPGTKTKGVWSPVLSWSGFSTDGATTVFANGAAIGSATTTSGSGSFNYKFKGGGTIAYQVCLTNTQTCSNTVTVTF
ncbi:MAG TPA: S8 family serine peptidase [Gemmatimonadaceae bacterium]|jgi:subtilisin family serine protease|nr:S8 family serine peptidase [Gemmatimonadaceae bacterium]